VILALPHLGGWEWCGVWLRHVAPTPVTVVVEPVEPPSLFEFFADLRENLGIRIVPLGPEAAPTVLRALKDNHIVCLLCDRDLVGDGVEVDFFGETTTIPPGPATLALRTGAPLLPTAVFHEGRGHRAIVHPPLDTDRHGGFRADVVRVTQELAGQLEGFIRIAPLQWHLQQPNWPSDYDALEAMGKPYRRPSTGPSSPTAAAARAATGPPSAPGGR
jgi:KDO2-lipid IV(A) lauroyltransferase